MTKDEALKLALEALESCDSAHITDGGHQWYDEKLVDKAITAIEEALAQDALDRKAENARELGLDYEPVAFASHGVVNWIADKQFQHEADLYATSHCKPLTDEEIDELSRSMVKGDKSVNWLCRAIEAAHGIKGKT